MRRRDKESDIIYLWFSRQLKAWCKKWWWLLAIVGCLAAWHIIGFASRSGGIWLMSLSQEFTSPPMFNSIPGGPSPSQMMANWYLWMNIHFFFQDFLVIPTLVIPAVYFSSIRIPAELILTSSNQRIHFAQVKSFRWFKWLLVVPLVILPFAGFALINLVPTSDVDLTVFYLVMVGWISFYLAAFEIQIWAVTKPVSRIALPMVTGLLITAYLFTRFLLFTRMQSYHTWFYQSSSPGGPLYSDFSPFTPLPYIFAITITLLIGFAYANSKTPKLTKTK